MGFICSTCGEYHEEELLDIAFEAPLYWELLSDQDRAYKKNHLDSDFCISHRTQAEGKDFFIRGVLKLPIIGSDKSFGYGVWVSLSEKNFKQYEKVFSKNKIPKESPYFGWLANSLPGYPDTLNLKTSVYIQGHGDRPLIELQHSHHPLALEQQDGITMERVHEIVNFQEN